MNMNKIRIISGLAVVALAIFGFGATAVNASHQARSAHGRVSEEKIVLDKDRAKGAVKKQKLTKQLFHDSYHSKDPKIRSNAVNYDDNEAVNAPVTKFFRVYYTFSDHSDYINRPKKLTNVASDDVLSNKTLFDNDIGPDHKSVVDESRESSDFNSINTFVVSHKGHEMTVLAEVLYDASEDSQNSVTGKKWFKVAYDTKAKKITSVSPIFRINNDNDAEDGD